MGSLAATHAFHGRNVPTTSVWVRSTFIESYIVAHFPMGTALSILYFNHIKKDSQIDESEIDRSCGYILHITVNRGFHYMKVFTQTTTGWCRWHKLSFIIINKKHPALILYFHGHIWKHRSNVKHIPLSVIKWDYWVNDLALFVYTWPFAAICKNWRKKSQKGCFS